MTKFTNNEEGNKMVFKRIFQALDLIPPDPVVPFVDLFGSYDILMKWNRRYSYNIVRIHKPFRLGDFAYRHFLVKHEGKQIWVQNVDTSATVEEIRRAISFAIWLVFYAEQEYKNKLEKADARRTVISQ